MLPFGAFLWFRAAFFAFNVYFLRMLGRGDAAVTTALYNMFGVVMSFSIATLRVLIGQMVTHHVRFKLC